MKLLPLLSLVAGLALSSCAALGGSSSRELVWVAEATGGAWSAGTKARAAMTSLDGIAELHMSGTRAVFKPKRGARITKDAVAAAFEEQGMELESLERVRRPRPAAVYRIDTGVTWAVTAGKVREALIESTGALDVYFEEEIEILVAQPEPFPTEKVKQVLEDTELEYTRIERRSF